MLKAMQLKQRTHWIERKEFCYNLI